MKQYARECILNRKDYIPGKPIEEVQKEFGITDIIKMASNENPMGTSPKAIEAMIEEVKTNSCRYPVSLCTELAGKLECGNHAFGKSHLFTSLGVAARTRFLESCLELAKAGDENGSVFHKAALEQGDQTLDAPLGLVNREPCGFPDVVHNVRLDQSVSGLDRNWFTPDFLSHASPPSCVASSMVAVCPNSQKSQVPGNIYKRFAVPLFERASGLEATARLCPWETPEDSPQKRILGA